MTDLIVTGDIGAVLQTPSMGALPLTAVFTYDPADSMAVSMTLTAEVEGKCGRMLVDTKTWVFARDLIDTAMSTFLPYGEGDVCVTYLAPEDLIKFELTNANDGEKYPVYVSAEPVMDFMADSLALVPAHHEHFDDVDEAIDRLLDVDAEIDRLRDGTWEL